ncbi:MAG: PH domain-containing protein [Legionellales bacterium]|nr:PH domain-containing protein [Legionellales bacterium]
MIDSNIVYQARLHWVIFFLPVFLFCLGVFLGYQFPMLHDVSLLFMVFSLAWGVMAWITYHYSSLTIKKNQVILRTGFWVRQTMDIPLSKIESIDIRRSILGSVLQYGTLVITGTGGSRQMIDFLNQPLTCRRYIEQLMG